MEQNEEFIDTLRSEIDNCEELERNARTEDFADRLRGRIEAKSQKISDLERRNGELESKIDEAETRAGY
jgi:predicted  nucleic acid-binding Zn-ribbon protein